MEIQKECGGDAVAGRAMSAALVGKPDGFPPPGFVTRAGAAALFGISRSQFSEWIRQGRIASRSELVNGPNGARGRIWSSSELERAREAMANPQGWVTSEAARALFGLSAHKWAHWVRDERVPAGRWGHAPTGKRCLLFPLDELKRLKSRLDDERGQARRALEPYPDPDRPGVYHLPVASKIHDGMEALIDADALPILRGKRCNWSPGRADRSNGGSVVCSGSSTPLGRIVMGVTDPKLLVSHVNGDRLDYRRQNLVVRTRSEVAKARKLPRKWRDLEPYPDPGDPRVVRIPIQTDLHRGMEALIEAADLPLVEGKRWNWSPGKPNPARDGSVVLAMSGTPKPTLARTILAIVDPKKFVSHRNGDRLDCRRENLIVRDSVQVKAAKRKALSKGGRACSSRFKGVSWDAECRRWSAMIALRGKSRQIGRFISEVDAALAYDAAARELHGEHAWQNIADPAEAERLRNEFPPVQSGGFPPAGMVDSDGASQIFAIPLVTWNAWVRQGRLPLDCERVSAADGGDCTLYRIEDLNRIQNQIRQLVNPYPDLDRIGCWRLPLISHLDYREAVIDQCSLPLIEGRRCHWQGRYDGSATGQVVAVGPDRLYQPLARIVAEVADVAGRDTRVSHRNGNSLDCRRSNLIVRSMQEQLFGNRKMGTINGRKYTSKFKGVSWSKKDQKWLANITRDRQQRRLGSFHDELAAAQAYDEAARELFGSHARLNFPKGVDPWLERAAA
jgi:hypothetical protein